MRIIADIALYSGEQQGQPAKSEVDLALDWERLRELLARVETRAKLDRDSNSYAFQNVEVGSDLFNRLVSELQSNPDLVSYARAKRSYNQHELDLAELLRWYPTNNVVGDDYYDTSSKDNSPAESRYALYDRCKLCSAPIKQIREITLTNGSMGKRDISATYLNEIVISQRVAYLFQERGLTGFHLLPVKEHRQTGDAHGGLFQLVTTSTLPAMLTPPTEFEQIQYCALCQISSRYINNTHWWGKIKYYMDGEIYYGRSVLEVNKDFNHTSEWFGERWSMHPMVVIAQRVYHLLREDKVKDWKVVPARLIE